MSVVQRSGFWVPEVEASRFEQCGEFEGLPNLDVRKVANCAIFSSTFGTALDVGAYIGLVSTYLARKFQKVVAFEPVPATFSVLQRNVAELPNVTAMNVAVGGEPGETYLDHYAKHGQLSHISSGTPKTQRVGPIPVRTIDSFAFSDVSFIKIDVEGYERPVVEGARETIQRCRPLIMLEQAGNDELHFGRRRDEASAFLEGLGMHRHPEEPRMSKDRLYTF